MTLRPDINEYSTELTDEEIHKRELESLGVKLRWSRVFLVSIVLSIVVTGITLLVLLILKSSFSVIFLYSPWIFFIECGLLFTFGGCVGTMKQSFTINRIKVRLLKGEKITGADTKIAIGSAYTYILTGAFLGVASLIAWLVV